MQQPFDTKVYDIVLSYDCKVEEPFTLWIREESARNELSFFLLDHLWIEEFLAKLRGGVINVRVMIDMSSSAFLPSDPFCALAQEVKERGGTVIDDPPCIRTATDKARFHLVLEQHGILVPPTIIVPKDDLNSFQLTPSVRQVIGDPFIVKPAWGGGGMGVVQDARSEADIQRSVAAFPSDSYLLQRRIVPANLDGRAAWFRIFHVFGELLPCWWDPVTSVYTILAPHEITAPRLQQLHTLVHQIARIAQMHFFSTEIAMTEDGRFYVVDYVNDACDMKVKSFYATGAPDAIVERIARLLVSNAVRIIQKQPFADALDLKQYYVQQRIKEGRSPLL